MNLDQTSASDRIAVVTGAGRGIGAAVASQLAADGHKIGLVDLDRDAAEGLASQFAPGSAVVVTADVSDEDSVERAISEVHERLGAPTILVNNAGVLRDNLLFKMSASDWDTVAAVHLRGAFLCARAAQKHMVDAGWGRIVNMSSASALGNRGQVNYAAAKAGLQGFTKSLALELGRFGVTANAVAPGFIDTDMTAATALRLGMTFDDFKESRANDTAVGRVGSPKDVAAAVSYFCSERAGFVTGQVLYVAGKPLD
jgi:3-oxoacyl-[acyl-carrier protein] reductase